MSDLNWRPEHLTDLRKALDELATVRVKYNVELGPSYDGESITFLDQTVRLFWDESALEYIIEEVQV